MTFDEAVAMVGTYLTNNDLSNSDNNDRFFYTILNDLRQEYAPTVEMTSGNKATFMEDGDSLSKLLTGYYGFDVLYWGDFSERKVAQAWLHPEIIKAVDE